MFQLGVSIDDLQLVNLPTPPVRKTRGMLQTTRKMLPWMSPSTYGEGDQGEPEFEGFEELNQRRTEGCFTAC